MQLRKDIFLQGKAIHLRPLTETDIAGNYRYWLNDPDIVAFNSHGRFPMTEAKLLSYVQSVSGSDSHLVLAIIDETTNAHIGNISLQAISWIDRSAEIAFVLGEREFWGKGVMQEAGQLLIDHGFNTLNLHRIHCGTSSANTGMQKLAGKLGMTQEGVRKDAIFKQGQYFDIIDYGLINKRNE